MDIGWISALVSVTSASVALGALVASVLDGRAGRRNAEFSAHRDLWWQRWSWVADRATSDDEGQRAAAGVMSAALVTRSWTTADDRWVGQALDDLTAATIEGANDDLEAE
ncbi:MULTISPECIES: hypothetical protein [unclassified Curtobacterium]|uniref:hypothetical protein n=1 Tax=unclassified Curtobacterium TaxID=257496 RepID=UPI000DAABA71|nr:MULTISPECIES: hypothetical protein [unclassified Curtobacterium]PZF08152.1 hypothetical protein DEI98_15650 [Curtobacterium sp. MCLR17_034]WIE83638.1 hypothetical protein DEJ29_001995 [Curtobacterium sp. MCPF17_021]